jgi:hypothetical protein
MKSTKLFLLLFFSFIQILMFGQDPNQVKKKGPANEYARSSISYLLLDFENEKYSQMLSRAINTTTVPSKFDNNELAIKTLKAPYYHTANTGLVASRGEEIRKALVSSNYALEVVKYWWKIKDDGSYSTSLIEKRGEYNATDEVVSTIDATKVGRSRLGDLGLKLIGNSYVMVLDFDEVKSMDEIYDAQDAAARAIAEKAKTKFVPVKRISNGFKGKIIAYLYKINYTDTVQGYFDYSFIDDKKIDINKLNKIFDEVNSPLILTSNEVTSIEALQSNPGEFLAPTVQQSPDQMMVKLVNTGILKSLDKIETRLEAFRVKTPVTNVGPIRAKIGKKESLKHERRYFVWEYIGDANNNISAKKKGVIRARKVVDNREDEVGITQESSFYQIGGGKITEGMTLQEAKDFGIGVSAGFGSSGFVLRGDINIGQWADLPIRQLKLYAEFISGSKEYTDAVEPADVLSFPDDDIFSQTKFAIGILKERPFARNFMFGWQIGYTGETITWKSTNENQQFSSGGLNWGLRLGANLFSPSFQLIGSLNGHHYGEITYTSGVEGAEDLPLGINGVDIFPTKTPISFDLSIRLTF